MKKCYFKLLPVNKSRIFASMCELLLGIQRFIKRLCRGFVTQEKQCIVHTFD